MNPLIFVFQFWRPFWILAAILDFGGHIEITKIIFSSMIRFPYKTNILTYYTTLWVNYMPSYACFTDLAAILEFGRHIEIIKIMYSSRIEYLYKNKHFDIKIANQPN